MICTSLGTAPGFVPGQLGDLVDLDGSTNFVADRSPAVIYRDGTVFAGADVWGCERIKEYRKWAACRPTVT